jgi:hypothetical protein
LPGPFQGLKQGQNQLGLWNGLSPLEEYEMPYEDISTATEEIFYQEKQLKVYPNPTSGILNLQAGVAFSQENCTIEIFNMAGNRVYNRYIEKSTNKEFKQSLNLNGIISGMYLVVLRSKNQYSHTEKVLLSN